LTKEEELSGLLNLALIALHQLFKNKGFIDNSAEKIKAEFESNSDTVTDFLHDLCIIDLSDPKSQISTKEVYAQYQKQCKEKKERPVDLTVFGKMMEERGIQNRRIRNNGLREHYYIGIKSLKIKDNSK
jgi:phage/plasmid-associated DNA primase